jgi:hypothetical protein
MMQSQTRAGAFDRPSRNDVRIQKPPARVNDGVIRACGLVARDSLGSVEVLRISGEVSRNPLPDNLPFLNS